MKGRKGNSQSGLTPHGHATCSATRRHERRNSTLKCHQRDCGSFIREALHAMSCSCLAAIYWRALIRHNYVMSPQGGLIHCTHSVCKQPEQLMIANSRGWNSQSKRAFRDHANLPVVFLVLQATFVVLVVTPTASTPPIKLVTTYVRVLLAA